MLSLALLAAATLAALGRFPLILSAVAIGIVLFFATEYTTHRFLLHAPPSRNRSLLRIQHRLHYDHHREPERLELLFLPLWFVIPVTALFALTYLAITRNAPITWSLVFGNWLGLLYYEWVHYVAHIPYRPRTPFGRWMKNYHLWHHFKSDRHWFGVTNPTFDFLHRTYAPVNTVERSSSTRSLHH